jgi:hypothetical protein
VIRFGIGHVRVEERLHEIHVENRVGVVLDVAAVLVFAARKEFGMTDRREMDDLGDNPCDATVPRFKTQRCGLVGVAHVRQERLEKGEKPRTRLAPELLPLTMMRSGFTPRSDAFCLHWPVSK